MDEISWEVQQCALSGSRPRSTLIARRLTHNRKKSAATMSRASPQPKDVLLLKEGKDTKLLGIPRDSSRAHHVSTKVAMTHDVARLGWNDRADPGWLKRRLIRKFERGCAKEGATQGDFLSPSEPACWYTFT